VDAGVLRQAAALEPAELRTLDALHLASAMSLGDDLDVLVAYDARLATAAADAGIEVVAPT
jgi:predicted nucleic acid-binding protein